MNPFIISLLQTTAQAKMPTNESVGPTSKAVNSMSADMATSVVQMSNYDLISLQNTKLMWFSYGFAAAAILMSLYLFFLVRSEPADSTKKVNLYVAIGLFALAIVLVVAASYFFKQPALPINFDMRTT